jgi:hypothetical protein
VLMSMSPASPELKPVTEPTRKDRDKD